MKVLPWFLLVVALGLLVGRELTPSAASNPALAAAKDPPLEVPGRTEVSGARRGVIAPTALQPVVELLVAPGTRVKKGQVLVKLDSADLQADLQVKKAALDGADVTLKEARRHLAQMEKLYNQGTSPEHRLYECRLLAAKAETDERAAKAAVAISQNAVDGCELRAPIDGVVAWLKASPGSIVRPGTEPWGEILDLSELDVRCELAPAQANRIKVGDAAEVRSTGKDVLYGSGKVTMIGVVADRATGLVPVIVRLANPEDRVRAEVPVQVRFVEASK